MAEPTVSAYLDHNVLDLMTKGDPDGLGALLERLSLVPVFSDENLSEIRRSVGYEHTFLELLEHIEARHLITVLDENSKPVGGAENKGGQPV